MFPNEPHPLPPDELGPPPLDSLMASPGDPPTSTIPPTTFPPTLEPPTA